VTAPAYDRLEALIGSPPPPFNGIDYVEVASADETQLRVHFLNGVPVAGSLDPSLPVTICGGETIGSVAVLPIDETTAWSADDEGNWILALAVAAPGDFSTYTLTIRSDKLDPYFDSARFSFKVGCKSDFDCAVPAPACEGPDGPQVPIDYLAKDFTSFKQALSDFSRLRYPLWVERSEADVGVMLMEALSAVADELSYVQDRVRSEATLTTATQRSSLVRHARLVDYEPSPAIAATTQLQLDVAPGVTSIAAGLRCSALAPNGERTAFEVGERLADPDTGEPEALSYPVDPRWNRGLVAYWWDSSRQCLPAGSTRFWLMGTGIGLEAGRTLLIDTAGPTGADPPIRELVTIAAVAETEDPVPSPAVPLTRVDLVAPTTLDHDLDHARTVFAGNLVPAVQGERMTETFAIPDPAVAPPPPGVEGPLPVVVRRAANWTCDDPRPDYRFTLATPQISWTPIPDAEPDLNASAPARPQISLTSANPDGIPDPWLWQRWLLDAGAPDDVFALTDERYAPVGGVRGATWFEYDGDDGVTIRFGDGVFGRTPLPGTVFTVTYLAGGGLAGNVAADTIVHLDPGQAAAADVVAVTNPFPATGGADEETAQQIRDRAPQAFRAKPLRVVRPSDYVAAAESLPWVLQAGTTFRWTGSWLTVFTTADPHDREDLTITELEELTDLLDRRRLAGYESYVLPPAYASVDLKITLCAQPDAFAGDVEAAVLARLRPGPLGDGTRGFFDHERWRFGQPLEASALLAAVQSAHGVQGVTAVCYRERGVLPSWAPLPETVQVPADRILRVDDDPSLPERGSLRVIVEGGK
jgi:hypothetical protein